MLGSAGIERVAIKIAWVVDGGLKGTMDLVEGISESFTCVLASSLCDLVSHHPLFSDGDDVVVLIGGFSLLIVGNICHGIDVFGDGVWASQDEAGSLGLLNRGTWAHSQGENRLASFLGGGARIHSQVNASHV